MLKRKELTYSGTCFLSRCLSVTFRCGRVYPSKKERANKPGRRPGPEIRWALSRGAAGPSRSGRAGPAGRAGGAAGGLGRSSPARSGTEASRKPSPDTATRVPLQEELALALTRRDSATLRDASDIKRANPRASKVPSPGEGRRGGVRRAQGSASIRRPRGRLRRQSGQAESF